MVMPSCGMLGCALPDRARLIRIEDVGQKVDGRKVYDTVVMGWFRARLTVLQSSETKTAGRTRVSRGPELLYELGDENGQMVNLHADDRVEVTSPDLGRGVWQVNGEPEIMRRRVGLVGGLAILQRVEEPGP